jgi:SHS2 domain-containing protein
VSIEAPLDARKGASVDEDRYEILDHTADVRVRIVGPTLERLFENAAWALFDTIVENLGSLTPAKEASIVLEASDDPTLLVDWMNELLYRFDARGEIHAWPKVRTVRGGELDANSAFRLVDWQHDRFHTEVKSVTYHGLALARDGGIWSADVVFDL